MVVNAFFIEDSSLPREGVQQMTLPLLSGWTLGDNTLIRAGVASMLAESV